MAAISVKNLDSLSPALWGKISQFTGLAAPFYLVNKKAFNACRSLNGVCGIAHLNFLKLQDSLNNGRFEMIRRVNKEVCPSFKLLDSVEQEDATAVFDAVDLPGIWREYLSSLTCYPTRIATTREEALNKIPYDVKQPDNVESQDSQVITVDCQEKLVVFLVSKINKTLTGVHTIPKHINDDFEKPKNFNKQFAVIPPEGQLPFIVLFPDLIFINNGFYRDRVRDLRGVKPKTAQHNNKYIFVIIENSRLTCLDRVTCQQLCMVAWDVLSFNVVNFNSGIYITSNQRMNRFSVNYNPKINWRFGYEPKAFGEREAWLASLTPISTKHGLVLLPFYSKNNNVLLSDLASDEVIGINNSHVAQQPDPLTSELRINCLGREFAYEDCLIVRDISFGDVVTQTLSVHSLFNLNNCVRIALRGDFMGYKITKFALYIFSTEGIFRLSPSKNEIEKGLLPSLQTLVDRNKEEYAQKLVVLTEEQAKEKALQAANAAEQEAKRKIDNAAAEIHREQDQVAAFPEDELNPRLSRRDRRKCVIQ